MLIHTYWSDENSLYSINNLNIIAAADVVNVNVSKINNSNPSKTSLISDAEKEYLRNTLIDTTIHVKDPLRLKQAIPII